MLRLKDITKNYKVAGGEIEVLKGLNVCFRKNEFVSILGPSGCGKTTTLNIVGGLVLFPLTLQMENFVRQHDILSYAFHHRQPYNN